MSKRKITNFFTAVFTSEFEILKWKHENIDTLETDENDDNIV